MPVLTLPGAVPDTAAAAFVAPDAVVAGAVTLAAGSSVWYGAVLRADTGSIRVGPDANIQDGAVLHTGPGLDITVGRGASVGHGAILHGCTLGAGCLVGMHATVLDGATLGEGCLVAAGALVPEGAVIPPHTLAAGVPARVRGPLRPEQRAALADNAAEYRRLAALHRAAKPNP